MQPERLVDMANQIGKFFQYQKKDEIVPGIASHIKRFWDPRMRAAIFDYIDRRARPQGQGGTPAFEGALQSAWRVELPGHLNATMSQEEAPRPLEVAG